MAFKNNSQAPWDHYGVDLTSIAVNRHCAIIFSSVSTDEFHYKVSNTTLIGGDKSGMIYVTSTADPDVSWVPHFHLGSRVRRSYTNCCY